MEPRRLQAGQGWQWIKQGYALFMKAPAVDRLDGDLLRRRSLYLPFPSSAIYSPPY